MSTTATKPLTAEQFFEWVQRPENRDRRFELVAGEIVEMSRPGERHGVVCGNVTGILWNYTRKQKQGYVCPNDTGLILERGPDTVRGPDVSLFRENRRYDELDPRFPERLPALIVEVLSPNDKVGKTMRRISQFLAKGVLLVWLVDPEDRSVTVYRPNQLPLVLEEGEELTGHDVLADFSCPVAELFIMPADVP